MGTSTRCETGCPGWAPRLRPEGGRGGLRFTCGPSDEGGREDRVNALKLLSEQHLEEVVRIQSTRESFAGQALLAGLLL